MATTGRANRGFRLWYFAAALLFTACSQKGLLADTVSIAPVHNAEIRQHNPDTVITSSNPTLRNATDVVSGTLGAAAQFEIRRAVYKFDLTGKIPSNAVINSVSLRMPVIFKIPAGAANSTFSLRRILVPWETSQITWNSRLNGTPWAVAGALDPTDSAAAASSSVLIRGLAVYSFPSTPALIADVSGWLNDPASNFGWLLHSESESVPKTARHFSTLENTANPPQLIINYTIPSITIVTQPADQSVSVGDNVTFSVVANGAPPLSYQWQFNGNPISGATSNVLQLSKVGLDAAGNYKVTISNQSGAVDSQAARLTILGQPVVNITSPTNDALFPPSASVLIAAEAAETNGGIDHVEFFLNTNSVGVVTSAPFIFSTNLPPSTYFLSAVATDTRLIAITSAAVRFTVVGPPQVVLTHSPPGTNLPLGISITNTALINTPAQVTNVDFFAGNNLLGSATNSPFSVVWTPAEKGLYSPIAVALDQFGQSGTSPPVILRLHIPESVKPHIAITDGPLNFARVRSSPIVVSGTAQDNEGVDEVQYQVDTGPFLANVGGTSQADGTSHWTATIHLVPGNNAVHFRSVDQAGNVSSTLTRYYTLVVTQSLTVEISGSGSVTPDLNHQTLEVGKLYKIVARPAAQNIFAGWEMFTNTISDPSLTFIMQTNLDHLVAVFVASPFQGGRYSGVFFDTNNVLPENSGLLNLSLMQNGSFTGKLTTRGSSYSVRGQFDSKGRATVPVLRRFLPPVVLGMEVSGDRLMGSVTNAAGTNVFVSELFGGRNIFNLKTNPAPSGQLPFLIEQSSSGTLIGQGAAAVDGSGAVRLRGQWSNGSTFSASSILIPTMVQGGNVPFYLSYRAGTEVIVGLPHFGSGQSDINGQLWWSRSGSNGFLIPLTVLPMSQ